LRIIVPGEYSQRVCIAFRRRGHEAYSCDLLPGEGGHPEWHFEEDVFEVLKREKPFDLMIAFPPCQYLAHSGVMHLHKQEGRWEKMFAAASFFKSLLHVDIPKIARENSVPHRYAELPKYTQIVQPYMFGDAYRKPTCLWLKNLPKLVPTNIVEPVYHLYNSAKTKSGKCRYSHLGKLGKGHGHERSLTPLGLAEAMSLQWNIT
jgi:hypothetical protein